MSNLWLDNLISREKAFNRDKVKKGKYVSVKPLGEKPVFEAFEGMIVEADNWDVTVKYFDKYDREKNEVISSIDIGVKVDMVIQVIGQEPLTAEEYLEEKIKFNETILEENQLVRIDDVNYLVESVKPHAIALVYVTNGGTSTKTIRVEDFDKKKIDMSFGEKGRYY